MSEAADALKPWVRAESLTRCALYWAGVSSTPMRQSEQEWFLAFLQAFVRTCKEQGWMPCFFLDVETIERYCQDRFLDESINYRVFPAYTRTPWGPLPQPIPEEETDAIRKMEKPFVLSTYLRGYAQWFRKFQPDKVLPAYFGFGGATILFVPPDPAAAPPLPDFSPGVKKSPMLREAFAAGDPIEEMKTLLLLRHKAFAALKAAFSKGMENHTGLKSMPLLIPRLRSQDFFSLESEVLDALFEASPVYLAESPEDRGIIIASAKPIDEVLATLVAGVNELIAQAKDRRKP
ncbi:MAG: hypothetical protein ACOYX1_03630 [Acidobacteriota bacterium]